MDPDFLWHTLAGGTILATAVTVARLLLDYAGRGIERAADRRVRYDLRQRDAEARLERVLQDRLAEADRRLEREHLLLLQAHELLKEQYRALRADRSQHADRSPQVVDRSPQADRSAQADRSPQPDCAVQADRAGMLESAATDRDART